MEVKKGSNEPTVEEEMDYLFSGSGDSEGGAGGDEKEGESRTTYVADPVLASFVGKEPQFRFQVIPALANDIIDEEEAVAIHF